MFAQYGMLENFALSLELYYYNYFLNRQPLKYQESKNLYQQLNFKLYLSNNVAE